MKKIAIVYASVHHKNTEKLLTAIEHEYTIDLINITHSQDIDVSNYEIIGLASGIYAGRLHKSIYKILNKHTALCSKKIFVICTSGMGKGNYAKKCMTYLIEKGFTVIGAFECKGYDTFGPLKLIGGIRKGHPNDADIQKGKEFINNILININ